MQNELIIAIELAKRLNVSSAAITKAMKNKRITAFSPNGEVLSDDDINNKSVKKCLNGQWLITSGIKTVMIINQFMKIELKWKMIPIHSSV